MSSKVELPPDHKRSLSVVARNIEDSLNDITVRLQANPSNAQLHNVEPSFTSAERTFILKIVEEIRRSLLNLIENFDIHPSSVTEFQIVQAQYTHIWTLLQDSYSDKMKGYGEIQENEARLLDEHITKLAGQVEKLKGITFSNEGK